MSRLLHRFVETFPQLGDRLVGTRSNRVPHIEQRSGSECGLACLAMALGYHGRHVSLDDVRARLPASSQAGVSAEQILAAAATYGLRGRGVAVDLADVRILPPGTILHWNFSHYVVLERSDDEGVHLSDPATGQVQVSWVEAGKAFTGVALLLEPGDGFQRQSAPRSVLWRFLREIAGDQAARRVLIMAVTIQLLAFAMPALTGLVVERIVPRGDDALMLLAALLGGAVTVLFFLASIVRARLAALVVLRAGLQMRADFTERFLLAPMRFVQDRRAGDLSFLYSGIDSLLQTLTSTTLTGLVDAAMALVFITLLMVAQPSLGFAVLGVFGTHVLVAVWSNRRLNRLAALELYAGRRLAAESAESVVGFETIKSLGLEQRRISEALNGMADMAIVRSDADVVVALADSLQSSLRFAAPLLVLLIGTVHVRAGSLSIGQMLALASLAAAALQPLQALTGILATAPRMRAFLDRIQDVLDLEPEQEPARRRICPPLRGGLRVVDVSFRYGPLTPMVLRDVSFEVRPGEFVAIVGRSGSGKSTLASLLLGLLVPEAGRIEYDGEDLERIELTSLRAQLGTVPQRPYLFSRSIRDNLTVGDSTISLDAVIEAAKRAHIHEDVQEMPLGYDTVISNAGGLSGGQRQRLALARALLRMPRLLLLDEATSALDAITERKLDRVIQSLGCSRVVIAHRLSTVERADRIVVIENGTVEAIGTCQELLLKSRTFKELYGLSAGDPARA